MSDKSYQSGRLRAFLVMSGRRSIEPRSSMAVRRPVEVQSRSWRFKPHPGFEPLSLPTTFFPSTVHRARGRTALAPVSGDSGPTPNAIRSEACLPSSWAACRHERQTSLRSRRIETLFRARAVPIRRLIHLHRTTKPASRISPRVL